MVTHLELDVLEYEVKWALGSITMNKPSGGDEIPTELFKTLKDNVLKCCSQYVSKFGKLSSGPGMAKISFHSYPKQGQCQRMLKLPCKYIVPINKM